MCGLFGFAMLGSAQVPEDFIQHGLQALHSLEHRGPDQWHHEVLGPAFLGHRRLSVIDLSEAGRQPFVSADRQVAVTVNGEIYNYKSLRDKFGASRFQSDSDSEVVLHGYRELGVESLVNRLDGMFAAVIYDAEGNTITLLRDHVGIKPLYYGWFESAHGRMLVWGSELKALVTFSTAIDLDLSVDASALLDFAAQRFIPAPKTLYQNICKLQPSHQLSVRLDSKQLPMQQRYWQLPTSNEGVDTPESITARLHELTSQSVREQLVADVPVGLFLSGGVDSSVLCGMAAQHATGLATYSIGFREAGRDETQDARVVADHFGTHHIADYFEQVDAVNADEKMQRWFDEPFGDLSALPTARVCQLARTQSVVAISGDGGDELFGGYKWYQRYWHYRRFNRLVGQHKPLSIPFHRPPGSIFQKLTNRLALLGQLDPLHLYSGVMSNYLFNELEQLRERLGIASGYDYLWSLRPYYKPELGRLKSLQYLDFHTFLPDDILTKVDRVSMDVSLEVRVPFLKRELCEYAFSLSEDFLYLGGELKGGMKHAFTQDLPQSTIAKQKQGFSIPWQDKIVQPYGSYIDLVLDRQLARS